MNRFARTQAQFRSATLLAAGSALLALSLTPLGAQAPAAPAKPPGAAAIIITNGPAGGETGKVRLNAPYLSSGISDIVRMFQAGVEEPVVLAFIQNSTVAYHPSAREIIYLRDLGLPQTLLTAMLKRGGDLRDRAAEEERNRAAQPAPAPPAPSAPTATAPAAQAPAVVYTSPTYVASSAAYYPNYVSYPRYSYAAYSYPAYNACSPAYGAYRPYYSGYYGGPSFGFSYGSCGPRFSVGFGYGGYYGGYRGYCGTGYRSYGGYGGYGYRSYGSYAYRGYGGHGGIRYAGYNGRRR